MQTQIKPTAEQVLVIDDDVELCKLVTRYLTQEGYDEAMAREVVFGRTEKPPPSRNLAPEEPVPAIEPVSEPNNP